MLHKFLEPGDWFAPKKVGLGSGWPIAWQGWIVLASYVGAISGVALLFGSGDARVRAGAVVLFIGLTGLMMEISRRRTRGGWHWRWGGKD